MAKSILAKNNRYPGLYHTASQIGAHFKKCEYYIECFAGLGRTVKYARASKHIILNDISEFSNKKCKKNFPNAIITNEDFLECIKRWNFDTSFFLIVPPWRIDYYDKDGKIASKINRKTASEYMKDLEKILPGIKGSYLVTLESSKKIKSPYSKLVKSNKPHLFGNYPKTMMFANYPLDIQIPTIDNYMETLE